jgi:hypothetical protein
MCAIHGSSGGKLIFHKLMFHTNIWKEPYRSTKLFQPIATKEHNTRKWSFELKERRFILLKQTKMTIALSIHRYGSITLQTTLYLQALLFLNYTR